MPFASDLFCDDEARFFLSAKAIMRNTYEQWSEEYKTGKTLVCSQVLSTLESRVTWNRPNENLTIYNLLLGKFWLEKQVNFGKMGFKPGECQVNLSSE